MIAEKIIRRYIKNKKAQLSLLLLNQRISRNEQDIASAAKREDYTVAATLNSINIGLVIAQSIMYEEFKTKG